MLKRFLFILCLLPLTYVWAAIDTYEFKDEETRQRFNQLVYELRCPKCQNQNLSDSNSPIASDLRREVYRMVQEGNDNAEIIDFMVARYGDFVLYRPPVNKMTYVLWYGPFALAVLGIIVIVVIARKRRRVDEKGEDLTSHLSQDEAERLSNILDQDKNK